MKTTLTFLVALIAALGACVDDESAKGPEDSVPTDGKLDDLQNPTDHGALPFGSRVEAVQGDMERYNVWSFQQSVAGAVDLQTDLPAGGLSDSVLYLYRFDEARGTWGAFIARNDDVEDGVLWSRLQMSLAPGRYRVLVKSFSDDDRGRFGLLGARPDVNRKQNELGRCAGSSRINVSRSATLTHSDDGTPPVARDSVLTLQDDQDGDTPRDATLVVETIDSGWVSPNWNIFSAAGVFTDTRRGASQEGTFDLVVGPGVGVLLMKTPDGQPWDFYRLTCDTTAVLPAASEPPVATHWTLQSRADDRSISLSAQVMLPSSGDELVLAYRAEQDPQRNAQLSVTTSATLPFASFVSGTFVDRRNPSQGSGSFDLVVGSDMTILLLKTQDGRTWDFFGGDADPEPGTEVVDGGVARCVVIATDGDFSSSRPPRRGDQLVLDLEDLATADALRFNGEGPADPAIPLNGSLRKIPQADAAGIRLESPAPGRIGLGVGVDIFTHGAGQLSTMWISQNLLNNVVPAEVSLALLRCGRDSFHTVPELPPTAPGDRCLVVSADGPFANLAARDVDLKIGDSLDVSPAQLPALEGTQTLSFLTHSTGTVTVTFADPLEERTRDTRGVRFFSPGAGGVHVDLFGRGFGTESVWLYHNVAISRPLSQGTWALLTCPSG